jgi:hypothetical protein
MLFATKIEFFKFFERTFFGKTLDRATGKAILKIFTVANYFSREPTSESIKH